MLTSDRNQAGESLCSKREHFRVQIRREQLEKSFRRKRRGPAQENPLPLEDSTVQEWYMRLVNNDIEVLNQMQPHLSDKHTEAKLLQMKQFNLYPEVLRLWKNCDYDSNLATILLYVLGTFHSYTIFDDEEFLRDKEAIVKVKKLLLTTNSSQNQILVFQLLGNLLGYDQDGGKARMLANYQFCKLIMEMWVQKLIQCDIEVLREFTWFLTNFFQFKNSFTHGFTQQEVMLVLPVILEMINIQDKDITVYCLQTLKCMIEHKEQITKYLVMVDDFYALMIRLMNSESGEIEIDALQLLMALFIGEENVAKALMEKGVLDHMQQKYVQPAKQADGQLKIKKIIVWGMANILANREGEIIQQALSHQLLKQIMWDGMETSNKKLLSEIVQLIKNFSMFTQIDHIKYALMSKNTADILIKTIAQFEEDRDLARLSLQVIIHFIKKLHPHVEQDHTCNMAIAIFLEKGLVQILERIQYLSVDDELSRLSILIHENYLI